MDDIFASLQPDPNAATPPPEAAAPAAPVDSTPPANPADGGMTAEEKADAAEWDKATEDLFPGLSKTQEDNNEQPKSGEESEKAGTSQEDAANKKPDESKGDDTTADKDGEAAKQADGTEDEGAGEDEPASPPELSASDRQELEVAVKSEIQEKMFTEEVNGRTVVTTPDGSKYPIDANGRPILGDADGDPIRTIDDVMKLVNPRTGEPFTEEQAGIWLLNANQRMRDNITDMNTRIEDIASTGLSMKEDSETVAWEYGELLKAMPELQKELWTEYEKTLVKDPKTGIVIKAPVSLRKFYTTSLEPYAALARRLETQAVETTQQQQQVQQQQQQAAAQKRQQTRQDRSDIYGGGKVDDATDEDKEWGAAAQAVFGDQLNGLRR